MTTLGQFELDRVIGRGGMAVVWRATHVRQGVAVALKVMTSRVASEPRYLAKFRNEVRAVARLRHPGTVMVLDLGEVDRAVDGLDAGSPYLAMELVPHGTVSELVGVSTWSTTRGLLLNILDALAHAHARGVVHRDLKPANILIERRGKTLQPKVADFGIAHLGAEMDRGEEQQGSVMGTPRYMAPEQIMGDSREQGPWTDLYALGCVAYELVSGRAPFEGSTMYEVLEAQLSSPVPTLGSVPAPPGFEAWVRRLLTKDPHHRFRCAADAAYALLRLPMQFSLEHRARRPQLVVDAETGPAPDVAPAPTVLLGADTWVFDPSESVESRRGSSGDRAAPAAVPVRLPPFPRTWRYNVAPPPPIRLVGAGLGLHSLRPIPMVGRIAERDAIWTALGEVHAEHDARCILLEGDPGVGKSRIASWMAARAAEIGAASVVELFGSETPGPADGLAAMVARELRVQGQDAPAALQRTRSILQRYGLQEDEAQHDAAALVSLMTHSGITPYDEANAPLPDDTGLFRVQEPVEVFLLLQRVLGLLASRRPVILFADGLNRSFENASFVAHLVETCADLPILVLATVDHGDEELRPGEVARIERLRGNARTTAFAVAPLPQHDHNELVGSLLGFDDWLTSRLAQRTAGHPLFAVQIVDDWVERGLLVVADNGFEITSDELEIPSSASDLWLARIERAVRHVAPAGREGCWRALEVAAALGMNVDRREWDAVCRLGGIRADGEAVLEALADANLVQVDGSSFTFTHAVVREALETRSRERGFWLGDNETCARNLQPERIAQVEDVDFLERIGRFWLRAERWEEAVEVLDRAAQRLLFAWQPMRCRTLFEERRRAVARLDVPADHPMQLRTRLLDGWIETIFGVAEAAEPILRDCLAAADAVGDRKVLADALMILAESVRSRSVVESIALLERALENYVAIDDVSGQVQTMLSLGYTQARRGDFALGLETIRTGRRLVDAEPSLSSEYSRMEGYMLLNLERYDEAEPVLLRCADEARLAGGRNQIASAMLELGHLYLRTGANDDAREVLTTALKGYEFLAAAGVWWSHLGLGAAELAAGNVAEAERHFLAIDEYQQSEHFRAYGWYGQLQFSLALCAAARDDWEGCAHWVEQGAAIAETERRDPDTARIATDVGRIAEAHGRAPLAIDAYRVGLSQWEGLDRETEAAAVRERLAALASDDGEP